MPRLKSPPPDQYKKLLGSVRKQQTQYGISNDELMAAMRMKESTFYRRMGNLKKLRLEELYALGRKLNISITIEEREP